MQIFLLLTSSAAAAACLLTLFMRQKRGRSLGYYFALGIALQFLLSLPAGVYQGLVVLEKGARKPVAARLAMGAIGAPFNMGGWTVRQMFDAVTDPPPPNPKRVVIPTAVVNYPVFLLLLLPQVALVAYGFAWRLRKRQDFSDPVLLGLGILFLVNSMANANWTWWGR